MEYTIVKKPAFRIVGKALRVTMKGNENMSRIPQFWQECLADGSHDLLVALPSRGAVLGDVTLGICMDFSENMDEFTYMVAAEVSDGEVPPGMLEKSVPASNWAVFEATGPMPEAIQNVWAGVWSEFFPSEPFAHAAAPDLELYPIGDPTQPGYRSEVWVPVVRK